ncbi:hypothetical protein K469DRAFT_718612 [Zopfia rhizophila CBS 207.26]|uniref:Mid2 domain-containing protein n=1 Tax=Zopfia rhizophila CBS 207.26 TaxID=1314779 RepID=A0A6A6DF49_9PEZI|nr:hypothetical protein K469DRAFT_718612 [Zopfia rhizophila CBS 207.26]
MASNSTAPSVTPSATPSLTTPFSSANPPTSEQPPGSTPVSIPSSAPPPSSNAPSSPRSSAPPPTSVVTASSRPPSTQIITSVVTPSQTNPTETPTGSVIVITSVISGTSNPEPTGKSPTGSAEPTSSSGALLQPGQTKKEGGGLNTGAKTAIAVVIPVVVVALLVLVGIWFWKKRKQRKNAEEARRKEVEEYGFNPNNDPTLPAVGMATEMAEDQSGYRGWGNATNNSNRKASTTLTSGMTGGYSDSGSNPGGYQSPGSPTQGTNSDGHSVDPLMSGRRETLDSEGIGVLGAAPAAGQNRSDIHRGPSNASSSYSAANRSDNSGEYPIPMNNPQDYYNDGGYHQPGPYGDNAYGGGQQPVIRDVSARRNTRIENPSVFPQQGNSGIAQNF